MIEMMANEMIMDFTGVLDYTIHEELLDKAKLFFENQDVAVGTRRKLIHIIIECLENVYKYSDTFLLKKNNDFFSISEDSCQYIISCGNNVLAFKKKKLENTLNVISESSESDIQKMYEAQLKNSFTTESKGAGLGFLRIALKCNNKIKYIFDPEQQGNSFYFRMTVSVSKV